MNHLGNRVTALVDGELPPDVAARATAHAAACPLCRHAVDTQRAARALLQAAPDPAVPGALMAALVELGGPAGPLPPRPGHLPGTPRPEPLTLPSRPSRRAQATGPGRTARAGVAPVRAGSASGTGPGRGIRRRLAIAVAGSVSLVSAGALTVVALSGVLTPGTPNVPVTTQLTVEKSGTRQAPVVPAVRTTSRPQGGSPTASPTDRPASSASPGSTPSLTATAPGP